MTKYVLNHNVISVEKLTSENIFPEFNTDLNKCVGLTVFKQHTFFFFWNIYRRDIFGISPQKNYWWLNIIDTPL